MTLKGKGFYIWKVNYCNGGDINSILEDCQAANLSHVLVKISDGDRKYNYIKDQNIDLVAPLAKLLKENGIQVWGWQYLYGDDPADEARVSYQRIKELDLDGYVANAEYEFKFTGKDLAATQIMQEMRKALPNLPMALSTYRLPLYHASFPYSEFLEYCDINMPQVYWQGVHNPDAQIIKSIGHYDNIEPTRPFIPTGSVYTDAHWEPTEYDVQVFLETATELGLSAVNFWSWDSCRKALPHLWNVIRDYEWEKPPETKDVTEEYVEALNSKDLLKLSAMYTQNGVHITSNRTIQGKDKLMNYFNSYFEQIFPAAVFKLTGKSGTNNSRHFTWEATSEAGKVVNGKDTFGLRDGKISYHYTRFSAV